MEASDLTIRILQEIRETTRATSVRLEAFEARTLARFEAVDGSFHSLEARIEAVNDNLSARIDLLAAGLKDLGGQQVLLTRFVKNMLRRHDDKLEDLDERVTKVETKLEG